MPTILPIHSNQINEARRVIYITAHKQFDERKTLDEAIRFYEENWPLRDLDDVQTCYFENGGTFLVMVEEGRIIGTGALRKLAENEHLPADTPEDKVCELKRLWFLPEYQGKGFGYQMMQALLVIAQEMGYTIVRLETSPAYQPRAYAFYHRLGFHDIPRYGDDPDDIGMELNLY